MAPKKQQVEGTPDLSTRLLDAGIAMFAARGFHATTTREIATAAGVSSAALYVHYSSKEELLHEIIDLGQREVLRRLRSVLDETVDDDPDQRLERLVETFAAYHVENHELARVGHFEMHHLSADRLLDIEEQRHAIDAIFRSAVSNASPALSSSEVAMTALAVQSMCIDIARWSGDRKTKLRQHLPKFYGRVAGAAVQLSVVRAPALNETSGR